MLRFSQMFGIFLMVIFCSVFILCGIHKSFNAIMGYMKSDIVKTKIRKWCDEIKMSSMGIVLATREWKFWAIFVPVLVIFGTLLTLLSSGAGAINLFFASDFPGKMQILGDGFLGFFGKDKYFLDFLQNFMIAFLQAILISMIVLVYKKRKQSNLKHSQNNFKQRQNKNKHDQNSDEAGAIQNAGIAAGLALLGSGCPTCGTTLITPILASIFSTSGYAVAGTISGIITFLAILLLLWSLKRVGLEAYAIIIDERWRKKHKKKKEEEV